MAHNLQKQRGSKIERKKSNLRNARKRINKINFQGLGKQKAKNTIKHKRNVLKYTSDDSGWK